MTARPIPVFTENMLLPEPWVADAACSQTDPEMFFPEKGGSHRSGLQICKGCNVIAECYEYSIRTRQLIGIWGGSTPNQRKRVLGLEHACGQCGVSIDHLSHQHRFCEDCAAARISERKKNKGKAA